MNPIPSHAVKPSAYVPKPTLTEPVVNQDAESVGRAVRAPVQTHASVHEHSQHMEKTAFEVNADIQKFIQANARQMRVSKDEVSGMIVVQLIDPSTGAVIRTLPSEELLRLARSFEMLGNTMVNQRA